MRSLHKRRGLSVSVSTSIVSMIEKNHFGEVVRIACETLHSAFFIKLSFFENHICVNIVIILGIAEECRPRFVRSVPHPAQLYFSSSSRVGFLFLVRSFITPNGFSFASTSSVATTPAAKSAAHIAGTLYPKLLRDCAIIIGFSSFRLTQFCNGVNCFSTHGVEILFCSETCYRYLHYMKTNKWVIPLSAEFNV